MPAIPVGASLERRILVTSEHATNHLGLEQAAVLATPQLIWQLEVTCRELIQPFLDPGEDSVGAEVHLKHLAATPAGFSVSLRARVASTEGRRVRFAIEAEDERERIAEGVHERVVVNVARFASRLALKTSSR